MRFALLTLLSACAADPADSGAHDSEGKGPAASDATIELGAATTTLAPIHGHYELSGALWSLSEVPGLVDSMTTAGFPSWRVGLGRWELSTLVAPEGDCAAWPAEYQYDTLEAVLDERDWFVLRTDLDGDGEVDLEDTELTENYSFAHLDAVLAEADAFGATPYVSIDHMPRALSSGTALSTPDCTFTFANGVSNAPPKDPEVFAAAVARVISHVVDGWGGGRARSDVVDWEFWNEPDLPELEAGYAFWTGTPAEWLTTYAWVAAYVSAGRDANPSWSDLRIGGGSFATSTWSESFLSTMDEVGVPVDFLAIHGYSDDAEAHFTTLSDARSLLDTWAAASPERFGATRLYYTEWGSNLDHLGDPAWFDAPATAALHAAVLTAAVEEGVTLSHRALFWDFYGEVPAGLVRGDGTTTPTWEVWRAFSAVSSGTRLDTPAVVRDDAGSLRFTVLASEKDGVVQVLVAQPAGTDTRVALVGTQHSWVVRVLDASGVFAEVERTDGEEVVFDLPAGNVAWIEGAP